MSDDARGSNCRRSNSAVTWNILLTPLWVASMVVSGHLLKQDLVPPGLFSWLVAMVPMLFGALLLWSYVQYIRSLDELWVKIYLRALAFSFGVSVVALLSYPTLELANAPRFVPFFFGAFSLFVFFGSAFYFAWRYR
jgi:hypothetical protein